MKKIGYWVLDHLKIVVGVLVFGIAFIVIGVVMLSSYSSYQTYVKNFDKNDLEQRSQNAALPLATEIVDKYNSSYGKKRSFNADALDVTTTQQEYLIDDYIDLTTSGGKISVSLSLEKKSFVDIVCTISSEYKKKENDEDVYGIKDLLSNIGFVVNGEVMDDVVDLPNSGEGQEWHKLVMSGFALPEGKVNVTISSLSGKNAMMPQFKNITFYSSEVLSDVAEEAQ